MPLCIHRWSTIKRWYFNGTYNIIQRCRRCDTWIKRQIGLNDSKMEMITSKFNEVGSVGSLNSIQRSEIPKDSNHKDVSIEKKEIDDSIISNQKKTDDSHL